MSVNASTASIDRPTQTCLRSAQGGTWLAVRQRAGYTFSIKIIATFNYILHVFGRNFGVSIPIGIRARFECDSYSNNCQVSSFIFWNNNAQLKTNKTNDCNGKLSWTVRIIYSYYVYGSYDLSTDSEDAQRTFSNIEPCVIITNIYTYKNHEYSIYGVYVAYSRPNSWADPDSTWPRTCFRQVVVKVTAP